MIKIFFKIYNYLLKEYNGLNFQNNTINKYENYL
jgi:hypothetical protein